MEDPRVGAIVEAVKPQRQHRQLCTLEMIAEGHADRCPGEGCAFWDHGCALARIEYELEGRADVARLLLDLRRELASGRELDVEQVHSRFSHILNEGEGILEPAPATASEATARRLPD